MKVKDLIERLSSLDPNKEIVFYHLEDFDLQSKELETILDVDGQIEITIKDIEKKGY